MTANLDACIDDLLVRGLDDLITVWDIQGTVTEIGKASTWPKRERLALEVIETLLGDGVARIGTLREKFEPWDCSVKDAIQRVRRSWRKYEDPRDLMGDFFLKLTEEGKRRGREIMEAERTALADPEKEIPVQSNSTERSSRVLTK